MTFNRKSRNFFLKIREIEIDNFYFKEKIADLSFDRNSGKTLQIT